MPHRLILAAGVLAASISLAACKPAPAVDTTRTNDEVAATAAELAPPLTAAGAPATISAINPDNDDLQLAAGVVQVDDFSEQPVHLFGVRGNDPGVNGLHVYASFMVDGQSSAIYPIADVEAYEVVSVQAGKIGITLSEAAYDEAKGELVPHERKIILAWTDGPNGGPPTALTVTPAT